MSDKTFNRIVIIGASGAGKSTLARTLGKTLGLPVIHIDPMYFSEGWVQRPREETAAMISDAIKAPTWIFEGNFSSSFDERAALADVIVVLELGRVHRVWRTIWRTCRYYGRSRPDMAEGCPEKFSWEFLNWVWNFDVQRRAKMEDMVSRWQSRRTVVHLTSAREIRRFGRDPWAFLPSAVSNSDALDPARVDPAVHSP